MEKQSGPKRMTKKQLARVHRARGAAGHRSNSCGMAARRARIAASVTSENGVVQIASPHSDTVGFVRRLYDCLGTDSEAFANQSHHAVQGFRAPDANRI
jgi:hypothetical protein